jgi:hypothetical protein
MLQSLAPKEPDDYKRMSCFVLSLLLISVCLVIGFTCTTTCYDLVVASDSHRHVKKRIRNSNQKKRCIESAGCVVIDLQYDFNCESLKDSVRKPNKIHSLAENKLLSSKPDECTFLPLSSTTELLRSALHKNIIMSMHYVLGVECTGIL